MKLLLVLFLVAVVSLIARRFNHNLTLTRQPWSLTQASGKVVFDKWETQIDPKYADVKKEIKDAKSITIDVHSLIDADDIVVSNRNSKFYDT